MPTITSAISGIAVATATTSNSINWGGGLADWGIAAYSY